MSTFLQEFVCDLGLQDRTFLMSDVGSSYVRRKQLLTHYAIFKNLQNNRFKIIEWSEDKYRNIPDIIKPGLPSMLCYCQSYAVKDCGNLRSRQRWSSLPVCARLTCLLVPPSTQAQIFRRMCLQSHLLTSPPTSQKSYPKFRNPRTTFQNTPLSAQICHSAGGRGGPQIFFVLES